MLDSFAIEIKRRSEVVSAYGANAVARLVARVNGSDITGVDGPDAARMLPFRGPVPERSISHHMWMATRSPRTIPLVAGLAATSRDDVDVWVSIVREGPEVRWELRDRSAQARTFRFNAVLYDRQLADSLEDLSWEDPADRTFRYIRTNCDHGFLKSQGFIWAGGEIGETGTLSIRFNRISSPEWMAEFRCENIDVKSLENTGRQVLGVLDRWIRKGGPGPRFRDASRNPEMLASIDMYP